MTYARIASALVVGSLGLVFACSGGDSEGSASSGFVSELCGIFASQCCGKNGYPTDGNSCRNLYNNVANGKEYVPAEGDACLAALRATQSNADFCQNPSADACDRAFKSVGGGAAPGAVCETNADCALSAEGEVECVTRTSSQTTSSACQVRVRGKEGDACSGTRDGNSTSSSGFGGSDAGAPPSKTTLCDTADNLHCDSATDKCVRIQDVGGTCGSSSNSYECVKSAYCDRQQKKCVARRAAGEACTSTSSFDSDCVDKHYCDGATKTCTATLPDDAACQKNDQCASRTCLNGKCSQSGFGALTMVLLCGPKSGG